MVLTDDGDGVREERGEELAVKATEVDEVTEEPSEREGVADGEGLTDREEEGEKEEEEVGKRGLRVCVCVYVHVVCVCLCVCLVVTSLYRHFRDVS